MSTSVKNAKSPTLDDLASDAADLRNAAVVARIVLEHCLAMSQGHAHGTYKVFNLLPQQIDAVSYAMFRLESMSGDLADAIETYHTAGAPR